MNHTKAKNFFLTNFIKLKNRKEAKKMTEMEILKSCESERQPVECWTRVMGYFRPYSHFNKGKKSEFEERKWFTEEKVSCECEIKAA